MAPPNRRPFCTPPGVPRLPNVPVCRPMFVTPFGGPASGISPSGGGPAPSPAPPPVPSCVSASIFADCFRSCTGVVNAASPGPVCGWTYIEPFGPLGGQVTFTPGMMSVQSFDADDFPIVTKPLPAPLATVFGLSGQFAFTEYPTPPGPTTTYQIFMNNLGITQTLSVSLFGDGSVVVQAGDSTLIPTYTGTWTPNHGSHVVHFSIDGAGIPTFFLDGVNIPLVFFGNVLSAGSSYPDNSINYGAGAGDVTPASSPVRNLFITAGVVGPRTVFCCP